MNALIFAAGLGTRLSHITKNKPKALVEVAGKPMLQHAIEKLVGIGVTRIIINVHHYSGAVKDFISTLYYPNTELFISDESAELLETGGGLLKAAPLFVPDKNIVLYNADVLTGADLNKMVAYHQNNGGIATLMVKKRPTTRYFLFDKDHRLSGWENISTGARRITRKQNAYESLAFSGIHIINPTLIPQLGNIRKFSITNGYLDLSAENAIFGWKDWDEYWFDIGTPEKLELANKYLNQKTLD
ncbi:nucleotidyltransferase family protein [Saccharicrinis sp. GN24d3]|uniref:nucleotidyltransferase family protein n=1 Tax=Saccharicrinis sp. GN24d3 TaxID=3458416 RepID=UPI004035039A